jgi:hypothetical protein
LAASLPQHYNEAKVTIIFVASFHDTTLYFDTSVFGGVHDIEFQELSLQLFEKVKQDKSFVYILI